MAAVVSELRTNESKFWNFAGIKFDLIFLQEPVSHDRAALPVPAGLGIVKKAQNVTDFLTQNLSLLIGPKMCALQESSKFGPSSDRAACCLLGMLVTI